MDSAQRTQYLVQLEADFKFVEFRVAHKLPLEGFPNAVVIKLRKKYRQP